MFQKSVINKYLKNLDLNIIENAYVVFKEKYNDDRITRIKTLKEEQYQEGFLKDIFVAVLGFIPNPDKDFNLTFEKKNETNSKKVDGAILKDEKPIVVIELKSLKSVKKLINMDSFTEQAFNYKNNHANCRYVITSNFQYLRFFIDNATEYIEFDLFNLKKEDFKIMYLLLNKESLFSDLPAKIKSESIDKEKEVTEELYGYYSSFKKSLFDNLVKNNPDYDKLTLFKKSQKLIDRFLFILFAEDVGLLHPNLIRDHIIKRFYTLKDNRSYKPLYDIFNEYFTYINEGDKEEKIPEYNGGLFKKDPILDCLIIDDDVIKDDLINLASYDFDSDIDVNILGHIFEHSLYEIELITSELEGTPLKNKRGKDGIFYTPKYITKYIVENTIGNLCIQKKKELKFDRISTHDKKKHLKTLEDYKNWLLSLKIVDPACGSGAFLNQALDFLIKEHKFVQDLKESLTGQFELFVLEKDILERNIYGVDINEESVEIAKLSLWLKTAQKGKILSNLSKNIKCGNSLIDDPMISDKAFNWNKEFPEIMNGGGFDVIVGNPPYIKEDKNKSAFNGLHTNYCYQGKMDLWYMFGALALDIIKEDYGLIGYIAPNNWITNDGASKFRNIIINKGKIIEFIDFGNFKVFESAGIQTMIYIMQRTDKNKQYTLNYSKVIDSKIKQDQAKLFLTKVSDVQFEYFKTTITKNNYINETLNFIDSELNQIIDKIKLKQNFSLLPIEVFSGIDVLQDFVNKKHKTKLGDVEIGDGIFNLSNKEYNDLNLTLKEKEIIKPFYTTSEFKRYFGNSINKYWIIYTTSKFKNPKYIEGYPNIKNHLDNFNKIITSVNKPYGLHRSRKEENFKGKKIFSLRKCTNRPCFTYTDFDSYVNRTFLIIKTNRIKLKFLTGLFNSTLFAFWLKLKGKIQGNNYQIDKTPLLKLPIIEPEPEIQQNLSNIVSQIITYKQKQIDYKNLFENAIKENNFDREITLKKELNQISLNINNFENIIDEMVYDLYGLDQDEIKMIEDSLV